MTPILVFTAEELWKFLPQAPPANPTACTSLYFRKRPNCAPDWPADKTNVWELLAKVRGEVLKALEVARNEKKLINSGLEAKVLLNADLELKVQTQAISSAASRRSSSFRRLS